MRYGKTIAVGYEVNTKHTTAARAQTAIKLADPVRTAQ